MRWPGQSAVGAYAWSVAVALGATFLDVVNASQASTARTGGESEAADFLLTLTALSVLAGIGAMAAAWERPRARIALMASLVVLVVGVLIPPLFAGFLGEVERAGLWLRLGMAGAASLLAFVGLWETWRRA